MAGPAGRLDVVLVCGGRWHDFDFARLELLTAFARDEHIRARVCSDYSDVAALERADALVTYTCDVRPSAEQQAALSRFVAGGGRWLALHATNAAITPPAQPGAPFTTPRDLGEVATVLGSQFLGHPPIAPYTVQVSRPDHPLVLGIQPFETVDELYVCELHGPLDVLLSARHSGPCPGFAESVEHEVHPVLYLRAHGAGSVCYLTLGHCRGRFDVQDLGRDDLGAADRGSWDLPQFQMLLRRCLGWAVNGRFDVAL
jgi:type 1 glutamine amidotransferase